jgi:hypothetical protein
VKITLLADRGFGDQKFYAILGTFGWDYVIRFRDCILVTNVSGATKPASQWLEKTGRAPAPARRPVRRRRGPLVVRAFPTLPPYSRIRAIANFVREEVPVLRQVPLDKKPGIARDPVLGSVPAHPSRSRLGSRPVEDPAGQQRRELAHRPPAWISDPASTQGISHGRLWHAHEGGYDREADGAA